MAEQLAEEHESHILSQSTSKTSSDYSFLMNKSAKVRPNHSSFPNASRLHHDKNTKNMANLLKLKYLQDKYENFVDKKSLEDILKNFK